MDTFTSASRYEAAELKESWVSPEFELVPASENTLGGLPLDSDDIYTGS